MIIVVASEQDRRAKLLASKSPRAKVIVPSDLTSPGWIWSSGVSKGTSIVAGGQLVDERDVEAAIVRIIGVNPGDLPDLSSLDRAFAAQEITAFLAAWLERLDRPVFNRPYRGRLAGSVPTGTWWSRSFARFQPELRWRGPSGFLSTSVVMCTDAEHTEVSFVRGNVVAITYPSNVAGPLPASAIWALEKMVCESRLAVARICLRSDPKGWIAESADGCVDIAEPSVIDALRTSPSEI